VTVCRADFREADVTGANLGGADLSHADLSLVNNLTREQLLSARSFKGAKLPDEFSDLSEPEEALIHPAAEDPALRGRP
jgi:uncharacterized protein YjbI with pentapeptide repeats